MARGGPEKKCRIHQCDESGVRFLPWHCVPLPRACRNVLTPTAIAWRHSGRGNVRRVRVLSQANALIAPVLDSGKPPASCWRGPLRTRASFQVGRLSLITHQDRNALVLSFPCRQYSSCRERCQTGRRRGVHPNRCAAESGTLEWDKPPGRCVMVFPLNRNKSCPQVKNVIFWKWSLLAEPTTAYWTIEGGQTRDS